MKRVKVDGTKFRSSTFMKNSTSPISKERVQWCFYPTTPLDITRTVCKDKSSTFMAASGRQVFRKCDGSRKTQWPLLLQLQICKDANLLLCLYPPLQSLLPVGEGKKGYITYPLSSLYSAPLKGGEKKKKEPKPMTFGSCSSSIKSKFHKLLHVSGGKKLLLASCFMLILINIPSYGRSAGTSHGLREAMLQVIAPEAVNRVLSFKLCGYVLRFTGVCILPRLIVQTTAHQGSIFKCIFQELIHQTV